MATTKNIHTVTLADGTTATRTSDNRTYSHAILVTRADGRQTAEAWSSRKDLADQAANQWRRPGLTVTVVPCTVEVKTIQKAAHSEFTVTNERTGKTMIVEAVSPQKASWAAYVAKFEDFDQRDRSWAIVKTKTAKELAAAKAVQQ